MGKKNLKQMFLMLLKYFEKMQTKNNIFKFVKDYRYNFGIGINTSKYLKFEMTSLVF